MNYILIGRGGHGKDTAKEIIEKHRKIKQIRMADYLKKFLIDVFELNKIDFYKNFKKINNEWVDKDNNFIAHELLDILKEEKNNYIDEKRGIILNSDFRTLMQKLGTEYFRKIIDEDFHVKMVLKEILTNDEDYIFTDIRFYNEEEFMIKAGIPKNKKQLIKFSNSIKFDKTEEELKKDFIEIVLGENPIISKKIENNITRNIKKLMKLNTNNSISLNDLKLENESEKSNTLILHIFRVISKNDFESQKLIYLKFKDKIKKLYNLNVDDENDLIKSMNIIGYIRTGMDDENKVFHLSEQELSLKEEYFKTNVISAQNLIELESKILDKINPKINLEFSLN